MDITQTPLNDSQTWAQYSALRAEYNLLLKQHEVLLRDYNNLITTVVTTCDKILKEIK